MAVDYSFQMVHSLIDIVGVENIVPFFLIECLVQTLLAVSSAVTDLNLGPNRF